MIRRLLALLLAAQALAALALAWGLWRGAGWHPAAALAAGVGAVLALRLAINLNNFRLSRRWRSAVPAEFQLGPAAALRLCWGEFAASLRSSSWDMLLPSPLWLAPAPPATAAPAAPPVLLLHGYACNGGYWRRLARRLGVRLRRAGVSHYALDLAPPGAAIDDFVPQVRAAVAMLCARSGAPRVVLLGHSMGGLVARSYLRADGAARVARLITLGSPHHGTALARLGPGANAVQMRHGGAWLAALARAEAAAAGATGAGPAVVSLFSHHDNIVAPQDSARLAGARNLAFGAVGHVALGSDASVMQCVLAEIAACAPPRGAVDSAGRLR